MAEDKFSRDKLITVRVTEAEMRAAHSYAASRNSTVSNVVREALLERQVDTTGWQEGVARSMQASAQAADSFADLRKREAQRARDIKELKGDLSRIGSNINQIAKAVNTLIAEEPKPTHIPSDDELKALHPDWSMGQRSMAYNAAYTRAQDDSRRELEWRQRRDKYLPDLQYDLDRAVAALESLTAEVEAM